MWPQYTEGKVCVFCVTVLRQTRDMEVELRAVILIVTVEESSLQFYICDVLASDLSTGTSYPGRFLWLFSAPPGKYRDIT
jgi:hypothetical protein